MDKDLKGSSMSSMRSNKPSKRKYDFYINNTEKNIEFSHKPNTINQAKYNIITFFPKALLFQFMRLANVYFLIIAIVQLIPIISPLTPLTAIVPITFVLTVSLIREGLEDYNRHIYDDQLNNEPVTVYRNNKWIEHTSGDLLIGEIVSVKQNDPFPADLILLDSNLTDGLCYIETATLDGEKTLKNKTANRATAGCFNNGGNKIETFNLEGYCLCDSPNSELYKFDGNLDINFSDRNQCKETNISIPLEAKQILLKGAVLRNTKWIIGFVVYTGHNTKLILNSKNVRTKLSRVENLMSKFIIVILIIQSILCIFCAVGNYQYYQNIVSLNQFLPKTITGPTGDAALSYFTYMLLLNTMIPISLIISLEMVKLIQGYFMSVDCEMYSDVRDKFVKAGSISLNEELGQVNFIFSDKTGTLTCNKMLLKYLVIGDTCYEYNPTQNLKKKDIQQKKQLDFDQTNIQEVDSNYFISLIKMRPINSKYDFNVIRSTMEENINIKLDSDNLLVREFWKNLTACHECIIDEKEDGSTHFSGLSPDDIELLRSAKEQGFEYMKSDFQNIRKMNFRGESLTMDILNILEFSSDRKRMSIIVKDEKHIKLYIKGADSEIEKRLSKRSPEMFKQKAKHYVDSFSKFGYRTLLVGMRLLDEKEYNDWHDRFKEASLDLKNKKQKTDALMDEIEQDVYLLGATIVEDKLQHQVPETIKDLRLAGIKIWMLTGDKMNTAYDIGLSCNLINHNIQSFFVCGEKGDSLDKLENEYKIFKSKIETSTSKIAKPHSVIIDSIALTKVLEKKSKIKRFLDISYNAASVICCRVSPLQKSEVVKIMKEYDQNAVTLSIGDGGNDVSMIMEAHIGIGVYGEEGMRAVQASDFAIGEFKMLRKLLLFHGRTNYIRITEMIVYFFFKNFVFTIIHFFYSWYTNCSGQTIIDDWFISLFNIIFTALPLVIKAILDQDLTIYDGEIIYYLMPELYKENRDNSSYNIYAFVSVFIRGISQASINFFISIYVFYNNIIDSQGNVADLWFLSVNLFTSIIFIASFRILVEIKFHTTWNMLSMLFTSWIPYIIFIIFVNVSTIFNSVGTMYVAFNSPTFYLNVILISVICFSFDLSLSTFNLNFTYSLTSKLRKLIKNSGGKLERSYLPQDILELIKPYENKAIDDKEQNNSSNSKKKKDFKSVRTPVSQDFNLPSENLKINNFLDQSSKIALKDLRDDQIAKALKDINSLEYSQLKFIKIKVRRENSKSSNPEIVKYRNKS